MKNDAHLASNIRPKRMPLLLFGTILSLVCLLIFIGSAKSAAGPENDHTYTADFFTSPNMRFGSVATTVALENTPERWRLHQSFWVSHNPRQNPFREDNLGIMHVIPIKPGEYHTPQYALTETWPITYVIPYTHRLRAAVQANPGELWAIGNEMDRPETRDTDGMLACNYAKSHHDLSKLILKWDPTAKISIGGIVQPTPLRLQYLDMVLDCYQDYYGEEIPVDVWNIHNMVLNEVRNGWGADIPPGIDIEIGRVLEIEEHDDMQIFTEQIIAFRQWMKDNGFQQKPLIVSEYGILMPKDFGFEEDRTIDFMYATFDYFLTAIDPSLGYAADDNRLVQRWTWYSFDVPDFDFGTGLGFNGALFDRETREIRPEGIAYGLYTAPDVTPSFVEVTDGGNGSAEIKVTILNTGLSPAFNVVAHVYDDAPENGGTLIGTTEVIEELLPGVENAVIVSVDWPNPPTSSATAVVVDVDKNDTIWEANESNNRNLVLYPEGAKIYLPILNK